MCIAIAKPPHANISDETLATCFANNPDGAGFAYTFDGSIVIRKGFFTIEDFMAAYRAHDINSRNALIHFRITTRGDGSADNCHPFALKYGALIHNGTIHSLGKVGAGKSDTQLLADMVYDENPDTLLRMAPIIEEYLDYSKVAVLCQDERVLVFNKSKWIEADGVLYSNDGYLPHGGYGINWVSTDNEVAIPGMDDEYDFYWENGLWRFENGFYVRDTELERDVMDEMFRLYGLHGEEAEEYAEEIDAITTAFIDEETYSWQSTTPRTPHPEAFRSASWQPTGLALTPSSWKSKERWYD